MVTLPTRPGTHFVPHHSSSATSFVPPIAHGSASSRPFGQFTLLKDIMAAGPSAPTNVPKVLAFKDDKATGRLSLSLVDRDGIAIKLTGKGPKILAHDARTEIPLIDEAGVPFLVCPTDSPAQMGRILRCGQEPGSPIASMYLVIYELLGTSRFWPIQELASPSNPPSVSDLGVIALPILLDLPAFLAFVMPRTQSSGNMLFFEPQKQMLRNGDLRKGREKIRERPFSHTTCFTLNGSDLELETKPGDTSAPYETVFRSRYAAYKRNPFCFHDDLGSAIATHSDFVHELEFGGAVGLNKLLHPVCCP
ncbi:hypothetical protein HY988_00890 [Candidatus Micrarchaeota archaeon]|nr:hypothetical protein [Candidatus Micrarchaeota archaeon]